MPLVGGSLSTYAPAFSNDDKLLCVPCGAAVKLFSVRTGEAVGVLAGADNAAAAATAPAAEASAAGSAASVRADGSHAGHTRTVTAVMPHPSNRVQLYTASLDGTVKLWDLYDQSCIATYPIRIEGGEKFDRPPILTMVKGAADLLYLLVDPYLPDSSVTSSSTAVAAASQASSAAAAANSERSCRILLYQLSKRTCFILYKVKDCTALAIDPSLRLLAAISGRTLRLYDLHRTKRSKSSFKQTCPYTLSTVTFHPSDPYVTVGDDKGHILIIYGYQSSTSVTPAGAPSAAGASSALSTAGDAALVTQTLHWHAHKVGAIAFTQDGHYMLSGGEEGVLVIWQLETGTKQFIPRLQSNILHLSLSHDGNTYACSMGDNRIKFVSAVSNRVERVIAGLSYSAPSQHGPGGSATALAPSSSSSSNTGSAAIPRSVRVSSEDPSRQLHIPFLYSPTHAGWFLNSILHPGALQLYDLFADRHLMDADLLQRNVVSRTEDGDSLANQPRIEQAVLHPRGSKMATLERRAGGAANGIAGVSSSTGSSNDSTILKFWDWNPSSASFVLNTRIEPPHSHATAHHSLVGMLYHPTENMVVTIGRDHCFRIWREIKKPQGANVRKEALKARLKAAASKDAAAAEEDEEECYWNCTGVGHYRSYPTSGGAFSSDGSLLAVAYGQVLTLWDPYSLTLKHTLLHPSPSHPIRFVHFIPHTPFVLTTTQTGLYIWNLLTLSLWWSFDLRVISVAVAEGNRGHFAVMVLNPEENEAEEEEEEAEAEAAMEDEQKEESTAAAATSGSGRNKPFRRRQTHLLLFTVHSPVPLRAWPLRDARLETVHLPGSSSKSSSALSAAAAQTSTKSSASFSSPILFASDPAVLRTSKRGETVPTSLIYINYKRQLVRIDDVFGDASSTSGYGEISLDASPQALALEASALARVVAQSEEISLFEQLYGKAHRPAARGTTPSLPAASSSLPALAPGGAGAASGSSGSLAALLNAPSHILPPPSSLFTAVMDGILKKGIKQLSSSAAAADAEKQRMQDALNASSNMQMNDGTGATENAGLGAHTSLAALDSALLSADSLPASAAAGSSGLFAWEQHPQLGAQFNDLVALIHSSADLELREVELGAPAAAAVAAESKPSKHHHSSKHHAITSSAVEDKVSKKKKTEKKTEEVQAMDVDTEEKAAPTEKKGKKSSKAKQ